MKKELLKFYGLLIFISFLISCQQEKEFILNENFDYNKFGWVEESTPFHQLKIDFGFYYLSSIDSSSSLSSAGSLDKSYLLGIPNNYEIETKIKLIKSKHKDVSYGIFLYGASIKYSFVIFNSGKIEVFEYDYNSEKQYSILSADSELTIEDEVTLKLVINDFAFKFFIDDYEIGGSKFKVKSWQELRLFTSKESTIVIDYLTIKEVK